MGYAFLNPNDYEDITRNETFATIGEFVTKASVINSQAQRNRILKKHAPERITQVMEGLFAARETEVKANFGNLGRYSVGRDGAGCP